MSLDPRLANHAHDAEQAATWTLRIFVAAVCGAVVKRTQDYFTARAERRSLARELKPKNGDDRDDTETLRDIVQETRSAVQTQMALRDDQHQANIRQFSDIRAELTQMRMEVGRQMSEMRTEQCQREDRQEHRIGDLMDEVRGFFKELSKEKKNR